jgi:hypothetical protein
MKILSPPPLPASLFISLLSLLLPWEEPRFFQGEHQHDQAAGGVDASLAEALR